MKVYRVAGTEIYRKVVSVEALSERGTPAGMGCVE